MIVFVPGVAMATSPQGEGTGVNGVRSKGGGQRLLLKIVLGQIDGNPLVLSSCIHSLDVPPSGPVCVCVCVYVCVCVCVAFIALTCLLPPL